MPAASNPTPDDVVTLQMAESYRSLALAGLQYAADLASQLQRSERTADRLRERLAERDAQVASLEAEITRYTGSMVARSEAA